MKVYVVSQWVVSGGGGDHDREILGIFAEAEVAQAAARAATVTATHTAGAEVSEHELEVTPAEMLSATVSHIDLPEGLITRTIDLRIQEIGQHSPEQWALAVYDALTSGVYGL